MSAADSADFGDFFNTPRLERFKQHPQVLWPARWAAHCAALGRYAPRDPDVLAHVAYERFRALVVGPRRG